jgi:hypothetical protein
VTLRQVFGEGSRGRQLAGREQRLDLRQVSRDGGLLRRQQSGG